jgi:hypothetical protein
VLNLRDMPVWARTKSKNRHVAGGFRVEVSLARGQHSRVEPWRYIRLSAPNRLGFRVSGLGVEG